MEVKDGKAFATLTDVKNLIGEVFSLADQYGEVVITSYNKPKYAIKRLERQVPSKKEPKESKPVSQPKVVAAPPVEVTSPRAPTVITPTAAPISAPVSTPVPVSPPPAQPQGAVMWWDRSNPKEVAWVEQVRKLL